MIFTTASSSTPPYLASIASLSRPHHHVGVRVGGAEDERLPVEVRVDLLRQRAADDPVEVLGDDPAVEPLDLDVHLVGQRDEVELLRCEGRASAPRSPAAQRMPFVLSSVSMRIGGSWSTSQPSTTASR